MTVKIKYLKLVAVVSFFTFANSLHAQSLWKDQPSTIAARSISSNQHIDKVRSVTLDHTAMAALLLKNTDNNSIQSRSINTLSVEVPLPDGSNIFLPIEKTSLLPEKLASNYPGISTYKVSKAVGHIISGRIDFTAHGFHALLQTQDGQTLLIDPQSKGDLSQYLSYKKIDINNDKPHQCSTHEGYDHNDFSPIKARSSIAARSNTGGITEYRLAVAATAEYTQNQGGTVEDALSAIVTTVSRVNHVYEQSLGVRFKLIANNDLLIYTNASTDPYTNYQIEKLLDENQTNIDQVIGNSNYDIGHVFGTSGGGLAYISSLCNNSIKAKGVSGISRPYGDFFDIDFVSHEFGHQLGATHTFNANQGICTSGARTAATAFEPGSGSTIMSYAGGCGTDNVQSYADAMFHSGNIEQMSQNLTIGSARACGTLVNHTNQAPIVYAGKSHTIPTNTPFELIATASDLDGDLLLYSWDQKDAGNASSINLDTGNNPLFRVLPKTTNASRTFPSLTTILGSTPIKGETLPKTNRTMSFQVSAYDGYNSPSMDNVQLDVVNTGKSFALENSATAYATNAKTNIYWETAETQSHPINCTSVNLQLSVNNGRSFEHMIAESLTNNGTASIYIPADIPNTSTGRFKLSCTDNVFFAISKSIINLNSDSSTISTNTRSTNNISVSGGGSSSSLFIIATLTLFLFRGYRLKVNRP